MKSKAHGVEGGLPLSRVAADLRVTRLELRGMTKLLGESPTEGRSAAGRMAMLLSPAQVRRIRAALGRKIQAT